MKITTVPLMTVAEVNRLANELLSGLRVRVVGELDERFDTARGYGIGKLSDAEASIGVFLSGKIVDKYRDFLIPGQKIVLGGKLGIYERYGNFGLTVFTVEPHGEGVLQQKLQRLKRKLAALGYFAAERKRSLPEFPERIGVITAKNSAAWKDFKKQVTKEYAGLTIYLHDALMQGAYAVTSIQAAFKGLAQKKPELIVLTRGGGSLQDLLAFNSQEVVEAIVAAPCPVITAIGHEIDMTLADLAADVYVSTPTKAAEIISSRYTALKNNLAQQLQQLRRVRLFYKNLPIELKNERRRLKQAISLLLQERQNNLQRAYRQLVILSPQQTLRRGYSITFTEHGKIIRTAVQVRSKDKVHTRLYRGEFTSVVQ